MSDEKSPAFLQSGESLRLAANMADAAVGVCAVAELPRRNSLAAATQALENNARREQPPQTCRQRLRLSFYFDGTGNNRDADLRTNEHSNVARMYHAAKDDSDKDGIYSFYIPGLGTYFMEIGDHGGDAGNGFGLRGEDRLQWALKKLQERQAAAPKLCSIDIALFGFSRGAALARAFANRVQKLCAAGGSSMVLKGTQVAVSIYFMGLWDTVASTGLPKSANNQSVGDLVGGFIWGSNYPPAARMSDRDVRWIAYGQPGADPAPATPISWAEGHLGWGGEMEIPPIVSAGVHMMAGHEVRNSFPVESTLNGRLRPAAFEGQEFVYPGVHSDVGGGYRPGEGGRSWKNGQELSLISLGLMYDKAMAAGVPLQRLDDAAVQSYVRLDFAKALPSDPDANHAAAAEYDKMVVLWKAYMDYCGRGSRPLGQWFLAHMKAYYAWRFWNIRKNRSDRDAHHPTRDEQSVKPLEDESRFEGHELDEQIRAQDQSPAVQQARANTASARMKLDSIVQRRFQGYDGSGGGSSAARDTPNLTQENAAREELKNAEVAQARAEDRLHRLEARKATLPSQGTLGRNLRQYDDRLYADAELLSRDKLRRHLLRPHYRALVQAWEDEFINNSGLINANVMKFFETYVHDSLADFNHDATLPSDPRVVYIGGDEKELFALSSPPASQTELQAA
jgi:hypothetical protein